MASSTAVYARSCLHRGTRTRSWLRSVAIGTSNSAAAVVRRKTRHAGLKSSTATLMNRYGSPQITPIAMKSSQPRRDIAILPYAWTALRP